VEPHQRRIDDSIEVGADIRPHHRAGARAGPRRKLLLQSVGAPMRWTWVISGFCQFVGGVFVRTWDCGT
jgi:hypothetical protein